MSRTQWLINGRYSAKRDILWSCYVPLPLAAWTDNIDNLPFIRPEVTMYMDQNVNRNKPLMLPLQQKSVSFIQTLVSKFTITGDTISSSQYFILQTVLACWFRNILCPFCKKVTFLAIIMDYDCSPSLSLYEIVYQRPFLHYRFSCGEGCSSYIGSATKWDPIEKHIDDFACHPGCFFIQLFFAYPAFRLFLLE